MPCEFPEVTEIPNLSGDVNQDYIGAKIGDINLTSSPGFTLIPDTRNENPLILHLKDRILTAGSELEVPVLATEFNDIRGLQLNFNNNIIFNGIHSGKVRLTDENYSISDEGLRVSIEFLDGLNVQEGDTLFTLHISAPTDGFLKDMIQFTDLGMKTEAYRGNELKEHKTIMSFEETKEIEREFVLYQNEPNPFNSLTNIAFEMPETAEATFTIYDATGKILYEISETYNQGLNFIAVNREQISVSGLLYYKLESGDFLATKKMIVID